MNWLSFTSNERIRKRVEFERVFKKGKRKTVGPLLMYTLDSEFPYARIGFSIPKRVGNAVKRNKIRRRCREAFRLMKSELPSNLDIVLSVRPHDVLSVDEYQDYISAGVALK
ncbi:MAG: ribonuclease P protein component [Planctomycetota bacterium]|nr:ribonuclease P protein component [Planctomycetota bacterium]